MSERCEWKDGLLTCCNKLHSDIQSSFQSEKKWDEYIKNGRFVRCPYCEVRIDNPEPEVKIKRSGETWVAKCNGVDYLCLHPTEITELGYEAKNLIHEIEDLGSGAGVTWKPISEIDITDEIAKLRPYIVVESSDICKLIYRETTRYYVVHGSGAAKWHIDIRLATVDDLE